VLYVVSDNDLSPTLATQLYSFAIDALLLNLQQQLLPGPLYPPEQVKKALKEVSGLRRGVLGARLKL
jgi:hypothetical protein